MNHSKKLIAVILETKMSLFSKRLLSTTTSSTIQMRPQPPKSHHHVALPSSSFPKGFLVGGIFSGIKKNPSLLDLGIILSTSAHKTSAAACFTRNAFKAAPVVVSDGVLKQNGGYVRGVIVNSGCANAVTGKQGMENAWTMVKETDKLLSNSSEKQFENESLVMSTGVIGVNLPISKIVDGIRSFADTSALGSDFSSWERVAKAFMTTDTFPKLRSRIFTIRGVEYRMAGIDKGAGMIHPNMGPASTSFAASSRPLHATLLGCIVTDAAVSPRSLQNALTYAVDRSFNSISVDGDMSTNDSVYVLANGAALPSVEGENGVIDQETDREAYDVFREELTLFAQDLAKLVVRDGEGATKFVTVTVKVRVFPVTIRFF